MLARSISHNPCLHGTLPNPNPQFTTPLPSPLPLYPYVRGLCVDARDTQWQMGRWLVRILTIYTTHILGDYPGSPLKHLCKLSNLILIALNGSPYEAYCMRLLWLSYYATMGVRCDLRGQREHVGPPSSLNYEMISRTSAPSDTHWVLRSFKCDKSTNALWLHSI